MGGGIHVWWIAWGVGMGASGGGATTSFTGYLQFRSIREDYQFKSVQEDVQFRTVKT